MTIHTNFQIGQKYNRLTLIEFHHYDSHHRKHFLCRCDCGNMKVVQGSLMTSGNTKSCGCYGKEIRKNKRISENHSEITAIILGYKRHAKNRGFDWLLNRKEVESIIKSNCRYCNQPPNNIKKTKNSINGGFKYSGIDRIDSNKGYTKDNTVSCCRICNYAKSNMSIGEFQKWAIELGKKAMAEQWG